MPAAREPAPAVIKVGGSLLAGLADLPRRIERLLQVGRFARPILLAGGGAAADLVRGWDRDLSLGEERAHRLALSAMAFNSELLHEILPAAAIARDRAGLAEAWAAGRVPVLDPRKLAEAGDAAGPPLPHLWSATSDSVSAWIALHLGADELVLAKSAPPPADSIDELAAMGYVDPCLPSLVKRLLRVRVVDLRAEGEPALVAIRW